MNTKKKAIILDRDGIINFETGDYLKDISQLRYVDNILETLKELSKEFLVFILTNQGGVAKGITSFIDNLMINEMIRGTFAFFGIKVVEIFFCEHHKSVSKCYCSKPSSLLLERITFKWDIEPTLSYVIGDMIRDIECGRKLGYNVILVPSNENPIYWKNLIK